MGLSFCLLTFVVYWNKLYVGLYLDEDPNMSILDNIVVGEPLVSLGALGVTEDETTIHIVPEKVKNEDREIFLPLVLKTIGLFKSTGEIKKINDQRLKNDKFKSDPDQNLWRTLKRPEFTQFKIGKRIFWLVVGEM